MTLGHITSELATSTVDSTKPILAWFCFPSPGLRHVDRRVRASVAQTSSAEGASERIVASFTLKIVDSVSDPISNSRFAESFVIVQHALNPVYIFGVLRRPAVHRRVRDVFHVGCV